MPPKKRKYHVYSDESGSWHDPEDVYVRSWVVVPESQYKPLQRAVRKAKKAIGCKELKWINVAKNSTHFQFVEDIDFRLFVTVSSPGDIDWKNKYQITRNFEDQMSALNFGQLEAALITDLKKKIFDDIRNILFLNFYERTHIANAKLAIDRVLPKVETEIFYKVDPPQMSKKAWQSVLQSAAPNADLKFVVSHDDEGIQFADVIAGSVNSFLTKDQNVLPAQEFLKLLKKKLISKNKSNPNPNLIFFSEINGDLIKRAGQIWNL